MSIRIAVASAYIACIVVANWLTNRYGLIPAGFGLLVTAGTYSAALALSTRCWLQDLAGRRAVLIAILVGASVSYFVASHAIALASAVAFLASELADMSVYTPLRKHGRRRAVACACAAGAVVDTLLFLSIAGFPLTGRSVGGQILVKAVWVTGGFIAIDWVVRRAVPKRSHV